MGSNFNYYNQSLGYESSESKKLKLLVASHEDEIEQLTVENERLSNVVQHQAVIIRRQGLALEGYEDDATD